MKEQKEQPQIQKVPIDIKRVPIDTKNPLLRVVIAFFTIIIGMNIAAKFLEPKTMSAIKWILIIGGIIIIGLWIYKKARDFLKK